MHQHGSASVNSVAGKRWLEWTRQRGSRQNFFSLGRDRGFSTTRKQQRARSFHVSRSGRLFLERRWIKSVTHTAWASCNSLSKAKRGQVGQDPWLLWSTTLFHVFLLCTWSRWFAPLEPQIPHLWHEIIHPSKYLSDVYYMLDYVLGIQQREVSSLLSRSSCESQER